MKSLTKFNEEVAAINEDLHEAAKASVRDLFKQREVLEQDPRQHDEGTGVYDANSPAAKWLEEISGVCNELVRLYIRHLASEDWLFNSVTLASNTDDQFDTVEGERAMYKELREWAEV